MVGGGAEPIEAGLQQPGRLLRALPQQLETGGISRRIAPDQKSKVNVRHPIGRSFSESAGPQQFGLPVQSRDKPVEGVRHGCHGGASAVNSAA